MRLELERAGASLVGDAVGQGPTVLLLHAGGERRRVWAPIAQRLAAAGFRAVAYDLRGHGESGDADSGSLRAHADDVVAMVAAEASPPVVVGASLGGLASLLAARFATTREKVVGLILVDVVPDTPGDRVRAYLNSIGHGLAESPLVADALNRRDELRAGAAALAGEVPVMLARGGCSPLSDDDARRLTQLVPDLRVTLIPQAGHLVARDAPADLAAAILEYLDEL